ncbi:MAG: HAD family hydrolase [Salibacteraceae bacterium]
MDQNLIVFDIDGTLTDSMDIHHEAFMVALAHIGVSNYVPFQRKFKHFTDSYVVKDIFEFSTNQIFTESHFASFSKCLTAEILKHEIPEILGAKELVSHLHKKSNYSICFATGSLLEPAKHKLISTSIPFNEAILATSDKIEVREEIVQEAINKAESFYNTKFNRIISIGDGLWDLQVARNLGLEFIGIGSEHRKALKEKGCKIHFNNPKELLGGYFRD